MKRTRKWSYVAQEATRLAGLGLSPREIGQRLGVNKTTVNRWISAGKLTLVRPEKDVRPTSAQATAAIRARQTPPQWAASVRGEFDLNVTDDQLVTLAETALTMSTDPTAPAHVRMNAAGRFQAIVRQLALDTRGAASQQPTGDTPPPEAPPERHRNPPVRRPSGDPRGILMAVNE